MESTPKINKTADLKSYNSAYYQAHKNDITDHYRNLTNRCESCNTDVKFWSRRKHFNSKKHQMNELYKNVPLGQKSICIEIEKLKKKLSKLSKLQTPEFETPLGKN